MVFNVGAFFEIIMVIKNQGQTGADYFKFIVAMNTDNIAGQKVGLLNNWRWQPASHWL